MSQHAVAHDWLKRADNFFSRGSILSHPCPVPKEPGVYGWYFRMIPPLVPTDGCVTIAGRTLLYVGIAPASSRSSKSNLRTRIRTHLRGNASGSTLRLSLGCLLANTLGIRLQRVGSRFHFAEGEQRLSEWLEANAQVTGLVCDQPWELEPGLIERLSLPLNIEHNQQSFSARLSQIRTDARRAARL